MAAGQVPLLQRKASLLQWYRQSFTVGNGAVGIAFDGNNIWVANSGDNTVTKLRAKDGSFVANYFTGADPQGLAFDGTYVWIANRGKLGYEAPGERRQQPRDFSGGPKSCRALL
jgi:hypothetical protein